MAKAVRQAGARIGFGSKDGWFDDRLDGDPRFLRRIETVRASLGAGRGVRLEDVPSEWRRPPTAQDRVAAE